MSRRRLVIAPSIVFVFHAHLTAFVAVMTRNDYHVTMNTVQIAELKAHLSEHLRKVRAGRSLTILSRDTPVASLVPWQPVRQLLQLRSPLPGAPRLQAVELPPPLKIRGDVVRLLLAERQGDR